MIQTPAILRRELWLALLGCAVVAICVADDTPADPAAAPSPELVERLNALFDDGFTVGPQSLKAAEKHLDAARRIAGDDPRLEYAHGLILVRQSQIKPAILRFEAAIKTSKEAWWSAWQQLIWAELVDRRYEKGLDRLVQFADLVQQAEPAPPDRRSEAAGWMGEVFEALELVVPTPKLRKSVQDRFERVRELFDDELDLALDLGRDTMHEKSLSLAHEAGQAKDAADRNKERRRRGESGKLASDLKDLEKEKEKTAQTAEEWKTWYEETIAKADKALGQLEKEYGLMEKRRASLDESITRVGQELTAAQLGTSFQRPNANMGPQGELYAYQVNIRQMHLQTQYMNYQLEYNATLERQWQLGRQAQTAMQQRAAITQKYEQATGELVKKDASLDKWTSRLADKKQKLDVKPVAKVAVKPGAGPRKGAASFATYLPLDFETEKQRVLESFGIEREVPQADVN